MMDDTEYYKEVYFDKYCKNCIHAKCEDWKDPCHSCLSNPLNFASHKPINYEEDKK